MTNRRIRRTKIRLTVNGKAITATLNDSETAQDFASLLPLTLAMKDLFRREKFAHLPRAISAKARHTRTYAVGEIAYWPPGQDVAIFYRHDDEPIPAHNGKTGSICVFGIEQEDI